MIPVPRGVLEKLAAAYRTSTSQLRKFGGGDRSSDGIVYAFPFGESTRLLKIMALPAEESRVGLLCLEGRLRFVRYLGENGARIVYPQLSPKGHLYETFSDENYLWVCYAMERIPGRTQPASAWDLDFFSRWGQTIGRCHYLAKAYPTWLGEEDPETGNLLLTWQGEWKTFHQMCKDAAIRTQWQIIKQSLEALPVTRDVFGFTHNDPHIWNLLVDRGEITLLDFDVANHHWFINDIAIACQSVLIFHSGGLHSPLTRLDRLEEFLGVFMQGYRREHDLPLDWLRHLDLFFSYRRILMYLVMYNGKRTQSKRQRTLRQLILNPPVILGS